MFASQLLRILQTIPSDARNETCVSAAEENMIMKEYDRKSFRRETGSLPFETKDIYQLNGSINDTNPLVFKAKNRDEHWNPFLDDLSDENGTRDSQNGISYNPICLNKDSDSVSTDKDSKPECRDSRSLYIAASDLFEKNKNLFSDKIVSECESPEVIVRYKEINYHIVKDISVDELTPLEDNFFVESVKDDQSVHSSDGVDLEFFESADSSLDDGNNCGIKLETNDKSESPSESSFEEDCSKNVTESLEEDSFIDKTLPFQEFGTRSFLRSFLYSLDSEGTKPEQVSDQMSSDKAVFEDPELESWSKEDSIQASSLYYDSQVERGSITFNFNSPKPVITEIEDYTNEKNSIDSENDLAHKDDNISDIKDGFFDNLSTPRQAECVIINNNETQEHVHDESNDHKDEICDDLRQTEYLISNNGTQEHVHNESNDHKDEICDDLSDEQIVEQCVCKHMNSDDDDRVLGQSRYEVGECSFSADGLMTYEGPIDYNGSLSVRSDSSAASGTSFAFPILQSEWNSSPVRMVNTNGTNLHKHKSWRSGILCCRF